MAAIGSAVVMETYFKKDRARYMGVWTLLVTLGIPSGPFIFGFVVYRAGYEWIYWVLTIVSRSATEPSTPKYLGQLADRVTGQRRPVHFVPVPWPRDQIHQRRDRSQGAGVEERISAAASD